MECGGKINLTLNPAADGKKVMLDVEGKESERILSELTAVAGKTQ